VACASGLGTGVGVGVGAGVEVAGAVVLDDGVGLGDELAAGVGIVMMPTLENDGATKTGKNSTT
jgi:hypothetical protein